MSDRTFLLPDLGEGLTEAEVVRWLVHEGDTVEVDQPVVEVETAKSLVEVPTPYAGRVAVRHAAEGATVDVGKPLLTVAALLPAAETYREEERAGSGNVLIGYGTTGAVVTTRRRQPRARQAAVADPAPRRVPLVVSPLVRRIAREGGVDLSTIEPTGSGGVIVRSDVERALRSPSSGPATARASAPLTGSFAAPASAPLPVPASAPLAASSSAPPTAPDPAPFVAHSSAPVSAPLTAQASVRPSDAGERRIPLSGFRKAVSAALSRSRAEIPEATVWVDVDATPLWDLRQQNPAGPGLLSYIARFTVAALRQYPMLNARIDTERQEIVELNRINLGIAVQGERGLVVPPVVGAEAMTTAQLDQEIRRVTTDAREGRVASTEAGTFTLNNYGAFRVDGSAAIINHPQVAILGLGRIIDRPWVIDGEICVRKITQMSFVFDHRVCDGGAAAGFMRSVADAIENPASAIARL